MTAWRWGAVLVALMLSFNVRAELTPEASTVDSRIRTVTFDPREVYRLYAHVGYAIELVFEGGETGAGQAGGDLEAITFGWHDNHLILKPKAANVGTNLIVYTNRRAYRFDYSATARRPDPDREAVMYAVQFVDPAPSATPKSSVDATLSQGSHAINA